jgi:hypothetical protein
LRNHETAVTDTDQSNFIVIIFLQTCSSATTANNGETKMASAENVDSTNGTVEVGEMTSKDYYFDSYAHFGIHEVRQNKRR